MWSCGRCGEAVEDCFGSYWHCGTGKNGTPPADPDTFEEGRRASASINSPPEAAWRGLSLYEVDRWQRLLLRLILVGFAGVCGLAALGVALLPPAAELPRWYRAVFLSFQLGYSLVVVLVVFRVFKAIVGSSALLYVLLACLPVPFLGLALRWGSTPWQRERCE